jgi:N-acylneuraminate cytidylyltransferase
MTIFALIPLRGGSKSIPLKNIKPIAGRPLCHWVLEAANGSRMIDEIWVSTDSQSIANVASSFGARVRIQDRPPEFATDEASTESVMLHFLDQHPCDTLVTIQATTPQLTTRDLDSAIAAFRAGDFDSMLSAVRTHHFFWADNGIPLNYRPEHRPRRQDWLGTLMENGAFYVSDSAGVLEHRCRLFGKIGIHEMDATAAVELDEKDDWERVERVLLERQQST